MATSDEDNAAGVTTEVGAARNCGAFLLELTKELPKEMTNAITTLQSYLESDEVGHIVLRDLISLPIK